MENHCKDVIYELTHSPQGLCSVVLVARNYNGKGTQVVGMDILKYTSLLTNSNSIACHQIEIAGLCGSLVTFVPVDNHRYKTFSLFVESLNKIDNLQTFNLQAINK